MTTQICVNMMDMRDHVLKWLVEGALRNFGKESLALNNQARLCGRDSLKTMLTREIPQNP